MKLLTEGLWAELLDTNVKVSVIMPGGVATNITVNSGVIMDEPDTSYPVTPADVAARVMLDGIERDKWRILVGRDARMMSLAIIIAPRQAIRMVQRQMAKVFAADAAASAGRR